MAFSACRVSLLPQSFQRAQVPELFSPLDRTLITHTSLAPGIDGTTQTATVTFQGAPEILSHLTGDVEFVELTIGCASDEGSQVDISVRVDVGFRGLTPLNTTPDDNAVVLVAVTGLAGRAFGSWQGRSGSMWLRDFLPQDVAHLRTLTYGYPSRLFRSLSTASLLDFTISFMEDLKAYLSISKARRLILVGHSMGCLIIKQALCECAARGFDELERAVLAVIFFGPPHRGLNNPKLQECVFGTPPETLVQDLRRGSSVLTNLNEAFSRICREMPIITCFEMLQTPTVTVDENGIWKRNGPPDMMVDRDSACLYIPNEKRIPIHANHSIIAKLGNDPGSEYHSLRDAIAVIVEEASGIRYQAFRLFHECRDMYKVLISAVEAGNQTQLVDRFKIELTRFELWGRLSKIIVLRSVSDANQSANYGLEDAARRICELVADLTDEGVLNQRFGIKFLSHSQRTASANNTGIMMSSPASATHTMFPLSEACLNSLGLQIHRLQALSCVSSDHQKALDLLNTIHRVHNLILSTLLHSGCQSFDQLFTAALLRMNSRVDFSGAEHSDGTIPSDVSRSATLKLLGLYLKSGIVQRLKPSSSRKVFPATLDLVGVPQSTSRFITMQNSTEMGLKKRVFIEWRYYDRKSEIAQSGDITVRIDNLMKILTCSPRPTSLRILDYSGYFHDFHHDRFGFVANLPLGIAESSQHSHRTLNSLLSDGSFKPSLTDRFQLARTLLRCVHQFHLLGWVHKGINSHNVIHFQMESDKVVLICDPVMTGFDLSREDSPVEISERNLGDDLDIYRYPDCRNGSPAKFRASFDIYALGLVLLEIGFWRPLDTLAKANSVTKSESATKVDRVLPSLIDQLNHRTGDRYYSVVQKCLQAPRFATEEIKTLEDGLIELDRCCL
ncbi:hypothetical protein BP5796_10796 [Coleophoma crateriformis]|uniref:DUF7580 domain-containing protein n=1 Tax=Coleophoma crateriformis TaxID=565419 RepID=A0A3D8QM05_9HELO|nr:hypothetical protein BP5796_10796 [Coleophoma crateriformis]